MLVPVGHTGEPRALLLFRLPDGRDLAPKRLVSIPAAATALATTTAELLRDARRVGVHARRFRCQDRRVRYHLAPGGSPAPWNGAPAAVCFSLISAIAASRWSSV